MKAAWNAAHATLPASRRPSLAISPGRLWGIVPPVLSEGGRVCVRSSVVVRRVPDPASIEVGQRTGLVDFQRLVYNTSPPDLCTVEEGLRLREKAGGQVTVLAPGAAGSGRFP